MSFMGWSGISGFWLFSLFVVTIFGTLAIIAYLYKITVLLKETEKNNEARHRELLSALYIHQNTKNTPK